MYKKHRQAFWSPEEIDFSSDPRDWARLSADEQWFLELILAFFAASDGIVIENLAQNFLNEVQLLEAKMFYGFQIAMESIHSETYALMIDTYIRDPERKLSLFRGIDTFPVVKKKADWAIRYIKNAKSFAERLLAFIIVEGIYFSGAFCAIFWLRGRGLMPGLSQANEFIARDEGLHTEFGCYVYSLEPNRLPENEAHEMFKEAVSLESEFITSALPVRLIGMNSKDMNTYICFCADTVLELLGYSKLYNAINPFPWMDNLALQGKTNFYERRVSEYQRADGGMSGENSPVSDIKINIDF